MENTWSEEFIIRTWDVDRKGRLHTAAAFNYFQEIAGNHAETLGAGKNELIANNQAWILSRMSTLITRRPEWGERIVAKTWPRGTDRLFAIRDYELIDSSNTVIGKGRSAWIVIDTVKLRPLRPQFLMDKMPLNEGMDALKDGAASLKAQEGLEFRSSRTAAYSDIDYNGHVNNARYVQWIQDALPPNILEEADSIRLDINYLSEVKPAASVDFYYAQCNSEQGPFHAIEGRHSKDSQTAFRAELRM